MFAQLLRGECEDDGVADGLEEKEAEEAADARLPRRKGHGHAEGGAGDTVETKQKCGVDPVQENDANEP